MRHQRGFHPRWNRAAPNPKTDALAEALASALASLRAATQVYQTAHWQASGPEYYADHQLYERLYDETNELTDALAERVVGLFGAGYVDAGPQATAQTAEVEKLVSQTTGAKEVQAAARRAKEQLTASYEALTKSGRTEIGLDDLIMSTASKVDEHLYLIGQRLGVRATNPASVKRRLLRR